MNFSFDYPVKIHMKEPLCSILKLTGLSIFRMMCPLVAVPSIVAIIQQILRVSLIQNAFGVA